MEVLQDLYPTRGEKEYIDDRQDPVIFGRGDAHSPLSKKELADYERDGFLIIPEVFSPSEIVSLKCKCLHLQNSGMKKSGKPMTSLPPGERSSVFSPDKLSSLFMNLSRERRILGRVQQILGGPVYLHRSRIHVKNGERGSAYPWHSEFESWHAEDGIPRMRGVEAWVMLTESSLRRGAMRMLAKSHYLYAACRDTEHDGHAGLRDGSYGTSCPSAPTLGRMQHLCDPVDAYGTPGSLVICDSNLMYSSGEPTGDWQHLTAMFSYNSLDNLPEEHPFSSKDFRQPPVVTRDFRPLRPCAFTFDSEIGLFPGLCG